MKLEPAQVPSVQIHTNCHKLLKNIKITVIELNAFYKWPHVCLLV